MKKKAILLSLVVFFAVSCAKNETEPQSHDENATPCKQDMLKNSELSSKVDLEQNIPNPFNQSTQIKFYLPETVKVAQLCIYNLQGAQLKQIPLTQRGAGSEIISGSQFAAGIYLYALIVDGKEVDVKQMILTN